MTTTLKEKSFCLTNTIDNYTTIGNKYYHNISPNKRNVILRPRIPIRFDMNDVAIVNMDTDDRKTKKLLRRYGVDVRNYNKQRLYQLKRTNYSITNTILLYLLAIILIITSIVNMKKIAWTIQNDTSLNTKDKIMFRICFIFSFIVVLFLTCFISLSIFELYRGTEIFPVYISDNIQYIDFQGFNDGNIFNIRFILLFFVIICIFISLTEILNLLFIKPKIVVIIFLLLIFILIGYVLKLLKDFYNFYTPTL